MADLQASIWPKCETCKARKETWFCNLPPEVLAELDRIKQTRAFSAHERLFEQGKPADKLMIVCDGVAILSFSSSGGNALTLGFSERGEVLGLSSAISRRPHQVSADALENTRVAVIARPDFLRLLERFTPAALNAGAELSRKVNRAYDKIRLVGSGFSVPQRLAAWLLDLQEKCSHGRESLTLSLTHEQIGQLLGASRESITRTLSSFKRLGVLEMRGIRLYLRDRDYLHSLLHAPGRSRPQLM
jgi:CRP/FNR family transcriptional regulator